MAIAYRGGTKKTPGVTATPVTGTEPTGTAQDDVMIAMWLVERNASAGVALPAGWTADAAVLTVGGNFDIILGYIVRGASAPSLAFTYAGTSRWCELYIMGFSGVDTTTPIDARGTPVTTASGLTKADPPAATASSASNYANAFHVMWGGAPAGGWTAPTNYTVGNIDTVGGASGGVAYRALSASGSEDPSVFGGTPAGADVGWAQTLILSAAAGAPWPPAGADPATLITISAPRLA